MRAPRQETPPGANPAARCEQERRESALDGVAPLTFLALGGRNGQPQLLTQGTADEATDAVRLPSCSLHDLGEGDAAGPFQQVQDLDRKSVV